MEAVEAVSVRVGPEYLDGTNSREGCGVGTGWGRVRGLQLVRLFPSPLGLRDRLLRNRVFVPDDTGSSVVTESLPTWGLPVLTHR